MTKTYIRVQTAPFDPSTELARLTNGQLNIGATVTFCGLCRDEDGRVVALELEHYQGMTEAEIERLAREAARLWPIVGLTIIHRYGMIRTGEYIVLVIATAAHRYPAFEAAAFIMDQLKRNIPFWKREHAADGHVGEWLKPEREEEVKGRGGNGGNGGNGGLGRRPTRHATGAVTSVI